MHQLIRASAGSGKTWQLTGHFLRQLFHDTPPETMLATTFTRKAAGEILGRVLERLASAAVDPAACAELADAMSPGSADSGATLPIQVTQDSASMLLRNLTRNLHRLRISTLDSFFQQVARSLTLELGLPPGWALAEEHEDEELRQRAIDGVLAEKSVQNARQLMQMLARGHSKRSVRTLIADTIDSFYRLYLLTDHDAWCRIVKLRELTSVQREHAVRALRDCVIDPDAGKRMPTTRDSDVARAEAEQWKEFLSTGIAKKLSEGETVFSRKPVPQPLIDCYEPLVQHARASLLNEIARRNEAAWDMANSFHSVYHRLRSETGSTRFDDITRLLARSSDAVEGGRMNYRLDSSIRHLLLDEFQDTSLDQWKVLQRLVQSITDKSGNQAGSVFCVGDPKQAIYGWRGGVAEVLDEMEKCLPDVQGSPLHNSRRSSPPVIDMVNRVFKGLTQHPKLEEYHAAAHEWSTAFIEHTTHKTDLPGYAELRTSPDFGRKKEDYEDPYREWVAQQIRDLHEQAPGATMGVLVKKNETVARLVHELARLGVPASEEGGTPPTDSAAVLAVMSLLHLASHPGCTVSRYHVANSPLAGLVELATWNDDQAAVATAAEIRNRLMDDGYGPTLQWIAEAIEPQCGDRDLLRMKQIVAEGWKYDRSPSLNSGDFVRMLESQKCSKASPAPVRVMTVHQSKGLEFDIVVAPELQGSLSRSSDAAAGGPGRTQAPENVCVWIDRALRTSLPPALQDAFRQTTEQNFCETLCTTYVTLTRAIHSLHLLCHGQVKADQKNVASLITAALTGGQAVDEDGVGWSTGDVSWFRNIDGMQAAMSVSPQIAHTSVPFLRLATMPEGRRRGLVREAPSKHDRSRLSIPSASPAVGRQEGPDGRTRGTLIHAWYDQVGWLDVDEPPEPDDLRELAIDLCVRELRIPESAIDGLLLEFLRQIGQPATRDALSQQSVLRNMAQLLNIPSSTELTLRVETERPFVFRRGGSIVQGTIDRLVIAELNGRPAAAEIIDFKTDRLTGDLAEWITMKHSDYAEQLRDYREAVTRCFEIPDEAITSSLLLLEADARVEVSPSL